MESVFMTEQEQKKVESFKNENRIKWEREQTRLEIEAERNGEAFTPGVYQEVSDKDALAAVRAGWKSWLDMKFEQKKKRDLARGYDWDNPQKK